MAEEKFLTGEWIVNRGDVLQSFRYDSAAKKAYFREPSSYSFMMGAGRGLDEVELKGTTVDGFTVRGEYKTSKQSGKLEATLTVDGRVRLVLLYPDARFQKRVTYDCEPCEGTLKPNAKAAGKRFLVSLSSGDIGFASLVTITTATLKVRDIGAAWETWYALAAPGVGGNLGISIPSSTSWRDLELAVPQADWDGTRVDFSAAGATVFVVGKNKLRMKLHLKPGGDQFLDFSESGFMLGLEVKTGVISVGALKRIRSTPYVHGA